MLHLIPNDEMARYKAKLTVVCSKQEFAEMDAEQRLYRFAKVIYSNEQLQAFSSLNWDRVDAAARACALLAATTGPDGEDVNQKFLNAWVDCKLRDIRMLKRILTVEEEVNAIEPSSPQVWPAHGEAHYA